jgi:hypothetical protein
MIQQFVSQLAVALARAAFSLLDPISNKKNVRLV